MKIAVIIPYKNAEQWLPRCLESIDPRLDVITIDDHSTDRSREIADKYKRISSTSTSCGLENSLIGGVSRARDKGLVWAFNWADVEPDYITFLDADDELVPDAYDVFSEAIRLFPDSDIIQLNHLRKQPNGAIYNKFYNPRGDRSLDNLPAFWVGVWNKIYKADLIKKVWFDLELSHGEDELFNLECLAHARKISCYEKCSVIHHFDNPESLSKTTTFKDLIREQNALINFLEDNENDPELCKAVRIRMIELWNNPIYKKIFGGA